MLKAALTPSYPDGFGLRFLMVGGLFFGLVAGIVTAFLLERLDTTAREDEDVALALGRTVLGSIPRLGVAARGAGNGLIMLSTGGSARTHAAREAFRRLRSSVQFLNSTAGVNSILVTSSTPGEGKSWTYRYSVRVPGTDKYKRRSLGLGSYPEVGVGEARDRAREAKDKIEAVGGRWEELDS